jgi:hypothetical protein
MANAAKVTTILDARDDSGPAFQKQEMTLRDMGEKISSIGIRMTAAFTLPIVAMGKMVLANEQVKASLAPVTAEFDKVKNELGIALLPVIESLKPSLISLADSLMTVIKGFESLPLGTQQAIIGFIGLVGIAGPVVVGIGEVMKVVGTFKDLLPIAAKVIPGFATGLKTIGIGADAALGPIGLLVIAVTGFIALLNSDFGKQGIQAGEKLLALGLKPFMSNEDWQAGVVKMENSWGTPKANGGKVYAGTSYPVGEQGPEIFSPDTNGTIIPRSAIGGTNIVNFYYSPGISLGNEAEFRAKVLDITRGH